MGFQQSSVQAYRSTRVKTASQGKIIVMLYDEALRQIDTAVGMLTGKTRKLDDVNNAIVKAQDVVTELMVALDFDQGGEIAQNLFRLYVFFNEQLMDANMKKDAEPLKRVRPLMAELRDAWKEIENVPVPKDRPVQSQGVNIAG